MTFPDPFADEAQAAPAPEPQQESVFDAPPEGVPGKAVGTVKVDVKPNLLPIETEGKHVLTFKGGTAFSDPWYVVHASGLDGVEELLGEDAERFAKVLERVQAVGRYFVSKGSSGGSTGGGQGGGGWQRKPAPQAATQAPNGEQRYCKHGAMKFVSEISKKTGKPYSAFFCNGGDRNDECKAQFLK